MARRRRKNRARWLNRGQPRYRRQPKFGGPIERGRSVPASDLTRDFLKGVRGNGANNSRRIAFLVFLSQGVELVHFHNGFLALEGPAFRKGEPRFAGYENVAVEDGDDGQKQPSWERDTR